MNILLRKKAGCERLIIFNRRRLDVVVGLPKIFKNKQVQGRFVSHTCVPRGVGQGVRAGRGRSTNRGKMRRS